MMSDNGIYFYIHIPFCYKKCPYCSFVSYGGRLSLLRDYIERLKQEIETFETNKQVETIYFGGGTPSLLKPKHIEEIINLVTKRFKTNPKAEITLETIPIDAKTERLKSFRNAGVNRLSIGVQSFEDQKLKRLGRLHNAKQSRLSIENASKAGFRNISIDLLYGLDETDEEIVSDITEAVDMNVHHISTYMLSIEPGSKFFELSKSGNLSLSSDDKLAHHYLLIGDFLEQAGFYQYEISNFSKVGYESRHNCAYWLGYDYRGFGLSASSFINGTRYKNIDDLNTYLTSTHKPAIEEELDQEKIAREAFVLHLRTTQGVDVERFTRRYGINPLEYFKNELKKHSLSGLIRIDNGKIRLANRKAMLVSNAILADFI